MITSKLPVVMASRHGSKSAASPVILIARKLAGKLAGKPDSRLFTVKTFLSEA
ncbi:MAG: hypothetical protein U0796_02655 [Gemmatales bacterium]